ncbi:hypothetical protein C7212DRAFT_341589 [Tuber magnatum]|uniref:Uncharacterized protein n=1 Tax=Tuber magnatum TaxID=42249 RepID=A0A317SZW0_9PEZI|nr:hypothetical protein C7212DRAFT_341589 [Tuber magnatum]
MAYSTSSAENAFKPNKFALVPVFSKIQELLISYLADSRYKARGLENALLKAFGTSGNLFDYCGNCISRTKVAATATTTEDTSACLFTNCNRPSTRLDQCVQDVPLLPHDMVLSLGTGSSNSNAKAAGPRGIWRDGFISRLYRFFISSMADDLKAMHLLNNASINQVECATKIRIAESLIANTFYFELDGLLAYAKGQLSMTH